MKRDEEQSELAREVRSCQTEAGGFRLPYDHTVSPASVPVPVLTSPANR